MPLDPRPSLKGDASRTLAARSFTIKFVCLSAPDPRSMTYASRTLAARRFTIKLVCLSAPDPRSMTYASRTLAARRFTIKLVCLSALGPRPSLNDVCLLCLSRQVFCDQTHMPLDLDTRSRTIALAVSLCFAVLVLRFDDTRFPLPLLTQISCAYQCFGA